MAPPGDAGQLRLRSRVWRRTLSLHRKPSGLVRCCRHQGEAPLSNRPCCWQAPKSMRESCPERGS
eukprot:scaffold122571_cov45-Phaeocystis_antarctica.AAC.1